MTELDPSMRPMFALATQGIESLVGDLGRFTPFALATLNDGQIQVLETSGEFPDTESAEAGLLEYLSSLHAQKQITGCLLCTPLEVPSAQLQAAAIMNIETVGCVPVRAMRQIKHAPGVATLADKVDFMPGDKRVF